MEPLKKEDSNWSEVLQWAEELGLEHMEYRHETAERLAKEGGTTLTLLLAGIGGSLAYAVKVAEPGGRGGVEVGAVAFCVYLVVVAVALTWWCLIVRNLPAIRNEPGNLAQKGHSIDELREVELENMQERIDETRKRNDVVAQRLNLARIAAACSPLVFVLAAGARYLAMPPAVAQPMTVRCVTEAPTKTSPAGAYVCEVNR